MVKETLFTYFVLWLFSVKLVQFNKTFYVGTNASLSCTTKLDADVQWTHGDTMSTCTNLIYIHGIVFHGYRKRFSVNKSVKGSYSLIIQDIELGDAGVYRCMEDEGIGPEETWYHVEVLQGMFGRLTTAKFVLCRISLRPAVLQVYF